MPNSLFCLLDWMIETRLIGLWKNRTQLQQPGTWVHAGHTLLLDGLWPACVTSQPVWLCWLVWDKQADPRSVRWDWGQRCGQAIPTSPSPNSEQRTFGASATKGPFLPYQVRESRYVTSTLTRSGCSQHHTVSVSVSEQAAWCWQRSCGRFSWWRTRCVRTDASLQQTAFPYFLFKVYLTILTFWSSCFNKFFWRRFYCIYCFMVFKFLFF